MCVVLVGLVGAGVLLVPTVRAEPHTSVPTTCTEHTGWAGEPDVPGDERCAGLVIDFHTGGVARSPGPLWAGQWLFTDEDGNLRVGSCTLNRGVHPTSSVPSRPVSQVFPRDPDGDRGAYLTWRYGDTADPLTAAAMWAVMHFYAQDAAGTRRSDQPEGPLVPALDSLAAMTGRPDLQAAAVSLDAEAQRFGGAWALDLAVDPAGVHVAVHAGDVPVPGAVVSLDIGGAAMALPTGADGTASVAVSFDPGSAVVVATTPVPGRALVYRGQPAWPDPQGAQTLVTGGAPGLLRREASIEVASPPTDSSSTTSVLPEVATSVPEVATTTTVPESTTTSTTIEMPTSTATTTTSTSTVPESSTSTVPPESTTTSSTPPSSVAVVVLAAPTSAPRAAAAPPAGPQLPRTGGGPNVPAYLATALLVAGIGLLGTVRRRAARSPEPYFRADG